MVMVEEKDKSHGSGVFRDDIEASQLKPAVLVV